MLGIRARSRGSEPRKRTGGTDLGHHDHLVSVSDLFFSYPTITLIKRCSNFSNLRSRVVPPRLPVGMISALLAMHPGSALAHVKWFSKYDVLATPAAFEKMLSAAFGQLALLSILLLTLAAMIETTTVGRTLLAGIDDLTAALRARIDGLLRAATAAFFIALWAHGGIILTPELATTDTRIEWLQAAIALGMLWRSTMALSGLGIVGLFALGIRDYGLFHMLDYPIFLGLAGYLALSGWNLRWIGRPPVTLLRWSAGITLMWASVEKWAYPDWTFPLLVLHPKLAMGYDPGFFLTASGMVEFGCAFALIWTPLVRRLAAVALVSIFTSAIVEFGKIDAIGHLPIIAALLAFVAETAVSPAGRVAAMRRPIYLAAFYVLCLAGFITAYYGLHSLLARG